MFTPWFKTFITTILFVVGLLCYVESAHGSTFYMCMSQKDDNGQPACWTGEKAVTPFRWLKDVAPNCELTELRYVRDSKKEVSIIKLICTEKEKSNVDLVHLRPPQRP